jgi:F-type H+-transporting ATPase subunit epsilon
MASTFELEIATPERLLLRETVTEAQIPAKAGYIGVLPDHAALLSELGIGELKYTAASGSQTVVVAGGYLEILSNNVRVLADSAEIPAEIDASRAQEALRRASERLNKPFEGMDVARALNAMRRAQARVSASEHKGS